MKPTIPILLIIFHITDGQEFTACRFGKQTLQEKSEYKILQKMTPAVLCKPWDAYYPRPTTKDACENSVIYFYKFLADKYEQRVERKDDYERPTFANLVESCSPYFIAQRLRGSLPQASIPKNAAQGGCRSAFQEFSKCMNVYIDKHVKPTNALRGTATNNVGHMSKLEQLRNWEHQKRNDGSANDPLL